MSKYTKEKRKHSTLSEILLWNELKQRKILGYRFTRQKPIANFIVDFYCSKLKLVIEVDGVTHDAKYNKDQIRDNQLQELGLQILRCDDEDILKNTNWVVSDITKHVELIEEKLGLQPPPIC